MYNVLNSTCTSSVISWYEYTRGSHTIKPQRIALGMHWSIASNQKQWFSLICINIICRHVECATEYNSLWGTRAPAAYLYSHTANNFIYKRVLYLLMQCAYGQAISGIAFIDSCLSNLVMWLIGNWRYIARGFLLRFSPSLFDACFVRLIDLKVMNW